MKEKLVFHCDFYRPGPFVSVQLMTSAYCELLAWEYDDLSAPFWRWYHNANGGAFIRVDGKEIALEPDKVYLIPPHVAFASHAEQLVRHLYFTFALNVNLGAGAARVFSHPLTVTEKSLIRQVVPAIKQDAEISFAAYTLASLALNRIPADCWSSEPPNPRIAQAIRMIRERPTLTLGNEELARAAGMNISAFIRLFHKHTGCSPHQYDLRLRIEKACWLLRSGADNLDDIAVAAGFCDRFHFSKAFKRYIRISPAAYRRQKQKSQRHKNSLT
ncbi:MAG: AraC family transcriptional regulator [Verrucomicrobiales bacterium]|jgi:AraC-like DNA-binding protein|nr:AraC family transcriptional regulator [Verrucomicrobiales bacterium]